MDIINKSLTARLASRFLVPLLAIFFVGLGYYWFSQRTAGHDASKNNARILSETLSFSVGVGLNDGNFDLIQTSFNWAKKDPSVAFILILDESNQVIIEHNPRQLKYDVATLLNKVELDNASDIVLESRLVEYNGKKIGYNNCRYLHGIGYVCGLQTSIMVLAY